MDDHLWSIKNNGKGGNYVTFKDLGKYEFSYISSDMLHE